MQVFYLGVKQERIQAGAPLSPVKRFHDNENSRIYAFGMNSSTTGTNRRHIAVISELATGTSYTLEGVQAFALLKECEYTMYQNPLASDAAALYDPTGTFYVGP